MEVGEEGDAVCLTSTETVRLIRDGEKWGEEKGYGGGARGKIICLSLDCHHHFRP